MAEYISREAVLVLKKPFPTSKDSITLYQQYFISPTAVEKIPAADVRPVVRGKWIPVTNGRGGSECNQCHAYAPSHQCGVEYKSNYCPNCGARMDGDKNG